MFERLIVVLTIVLGGCWTATSSTITGVSLTPQDQTIQLEQELQLSANVKGIGIYNSSVQWRASGGLLTPSHNQATFKSNLAGSFKVTATSIQDASKFADTTIAVTASSTCLPKNTPVLYRPQVPPSSIDPPPPLGNGSVVKEEVGDTLLLRSSRYQLKLTKSNGAILEILDLQRNQLLSLGSKGGCLWGGSFFPEGSLEDSVYVGGCSYNPSQISYAWNASLKTLTFTYKGIASGNPRLDATVELRVLDEAFDLKIELSNTTGMRLGRLYLPSDLMFADSAVSAGYAGFGMPGVRFNSDFFKTPMDAVPPYPSLWAFTDLIALDIGNSHLAQYTLNPPPGPVVPASVGFYDPTRDQGSTFNPDHFIVYRAYRTGIPSGQTYTSPFIRVWIGHPIAEVIQYQRFDNGISAFPSVAQKLGRRYSAFVQAPLVKADLWHLNLPFAEWPKHFKQASGPLLLHPVAYWSLPPGRGTGPSFDENTPDFLPHDPRWGDPQSFRTMTQEAQDCLHLVMPYTNPTWWDDESKTYQSFSNIDALDIAGQPTREEFGTAVKHGGYVVSPHAPGVKSFLAKLMNRWKSEVGVDCIFEDQIGARPRDYDLNRAAPAANRYGEGWLEHTRQHQHRCLMTEQGWDRLAETEVGFMGSLQLTCELAPPSWLRQGLYQLYPLANLLFGDKVLLYQHDLSQCSLLPTQGTAGSPSDKALLRWNAAFGLMLGYRWSEEVTNQLDGQTLDWVVALQRAMASRYAGHRIQSYKELASQVFESDFGGVKVISNWNTDAVFSGQEHTLAAGGFMAEADGQMLAGIFTRLFGQNLSGEHGLVIEWGNARVLVHKPLGGDTTLTLPVGFTPKQIQAFGRDGVVLGSAQPATSNGKVMFEYRTEVGGATVGWYEVK